MRMNEITSWPVTEGWRDWAATATVAGGLALASIPGAWAKSPAPRHTRASRPAPAESRDVLIRTALAAGIRGTELAAFLAQCAHETLDFRRLREIGGNQNFQKYDPAFDQRKAKLLGNTHPGDGARYAGRGYIQITGRDNYRRVGHALDLPLEDKPDLAAKPQIAAQVAVWFWKNRVAPHVNDFTDVRAVTRYINPALQGLSDRMDKFQKYLAQLKKTSTARETSGSTTMGAPAKINQSTRPATSRSSRS
jgi:putative chitinase